MNLLRYITTIIIVFLCAFSLLLVGCQQRTPTSTTFLLLPSPTRQVQYSDDWEEIHFPTTSIKLLMDWSWVLYTYSDAIWIAPIKEGQVGTPSLVARNEEAKVDFSLLDSPPGHSAFVIQSWEYSTKPYTSTLWLVQPSSPDRLIRVYEGRDPILRANWSPDGNHVVLVSHSGRADLVTNFWVDNQSVIPISHNLRLNSKVAWSSASNRIFYSGQTEISDKWYMGGWMLDVNSLEATLLFTTMWAFEPSWSSDGELVVTLGREDTEYNDWEMHLLSPAGVFLDTIALPGLQRAGGVKWSPDSSCIALLVAKVGKGDDEIGLVNLSSREFSTISVPRLSQIIDWSQDGDAVIVLTFDGLMKKVPVTKE